MLFENGCNFKSNCSIWKNSNLNLEYEAKMLYLIKFVIVPDSKLNNSKREF